MADKKRVIESTAAEDMEAVRMVSTQLARLLIRLHRMAVNVPYAPYTSSWTAANNLH